MLPDPLAELRYEMYKIASVTKEAKEFEEKYPACISSAEKIKLKDIAAWAKAHKRIFFDVDYDEEFEKRKRRSHRLARKYGLPHEPDEYDKSESKFNQFKRKLRTWVRKYKALWIVELVKPFQEGLIFIINPMTRSIIDLERENLEEPESENIYEDEEEDEEDEEIDAEIEEDTLEGEQPERGKLGSEYKFGGS